MEEEVKLLSCWASGFGMRAQLALEAKGIKYQYIEQDLSNKSQLLLSSNPVYKKVPILVHNGKSICESRVIVEYIDETWPATPRLLPDNPYDRYLVRFWSDFINNKRWKIWAYFGDFKSKSAKERRGMLKKVEAEYAEMGQTLECGVAELERRGCLYDGQDLKYMDVFYAPSLAWAGPLEKMMGFKIVDGEKCPGLHRWGQSLINNQVVKSTLPGGDKLLDYFKKKWGLESFV
ncbi:hypothetical protein KI387_033937 [Taxus chinensis]|uniref:glutathione transferase n=1 Tax=Taxus chinensis TaxID=29808 RepID=A0AA38BUC5_TAXCH|nr:hypothetical protein KI387_033937 [Taxus chinensis]